MALDTLSRRAARRLRDPPVFCLPSVRGRRTVEPDPGGDPDECVVLERRQVPQPRHTQWAAVVASRQAARLAGRGPVRNVPAVTATGQGYPGIHTRRGCRWKIGGREVGESGGPKHRPRCSTRSDRALASRRGRGSPRETELAARSQRAGQSADNRPPRFQGYVAVPAPSRDHQHC